jgi:hypothetical protein
VRAGDDERRAHYRAKILELAAQSFIEGRNVEALAWRGVLRCGHDWLLDSGFWTCRLCGDVALRTPLLEIPVAAETLGQLPDTVRAE